MAAPSRIVVDQWTPLSHIEAIGNGDRLDVAALKVAPTWVPASERRRLNAYMVRAAMLANGARQFLPRGITEADRDDYREYGDPAVLVERISAAVLGDGWTISVDGAADDLSAGPSLPTAPAPLGDDATDLENRIYAALTAAYDREATASVDMWEAALEAQPAVRERQAVIDAWADRSQLRAHIDEAEHDTDGLGDAVIALWPGSEGEWPMVEVYDPGVYFPVLDESGDDDGQFPATVHLAWEFDATDDLGMIERFVRRITFELVDIADLSVTLDRGDLRWIGADGEPADSPALRAGDKLDGAGRIVRTLPWLDSDGDEITTERTCVRRDGTWRLADVQSGRYDALDDDQALGGIASVDLGCDFVPVVHLPCRQGKGHWGSAVIDTVAQLLGDVARNDGDIMIASEFLGAPVVAMSGKRDLPSTEAVQPGHAYSTGEGGRMDTLDLSSGIEWLMKLGDRLAARVGANVGVPAEVMGRFDGGTIAGITLLLKWAPFAQLIGALRQVREPKHRLLLKMAQRLAMVTGAIEPGTVPTARIAYGNFLPTDRETTLQLVAAAVTAHVMSTQTAVAMLIAAGVPVDDAADELERIRHENFAGAKDLADAVGSELASADFLGLDVAPIATVAPPRIDLPPAP